MRCGACGHRWLQAAQAPEPGIEATEASLGDGLPAHGREARISVSPPSERLIPLRESPAPEPVEGRRWSGFLLGLAAALLLSAFGAGILFREAIMQALPASRALYAALGLGPTDPHAQLEVANLANEERSAGGRKVMDVSGVIFNRGERPAALPSLLIVFTDDGGRRIEPANEFRFKESEIAPGETLAFRASEIEMPAGASSIAVELAGP